MDLEGIIGQIKHNCNISDARFWGYYSICGLLLRMRSLYRHERGLMPWERIPSDDLSSWIGDRERLWEKLAQQEFQEINIDGNCFDPFEIESINKILNKRGLLYGGGYGTFGKPVFFLAYLTGTGQLYDYNVYYANKELCRDLSTSIALLQGVCIILRHEQLSLMLWEKFEEMRAKRFQGILDRAFSLYGINKATNEDISSFEMVKNISDEIADIFVFHEVGEAVEERHDLDWLNMANGNRWLELNLRGIKDLLADTSDYGPLNLIIKRRDEKLFLFYLIFLDGIRRDLFPEIINSYKAFLDSKDWDIIDKARIKGYDRARSLMERLRCMINQKIDTSQLKNIINESLL